MAPFLTLALAQFQPRKGDYAGNLARIGELLAQCASLEPRPRLVCFPESALSGYFLEGGVREHAVTTGRLAADLHRVYGDGPPVDVCIGFYEVWRNKLYNSAVYLSLGETMPLVRHVHRKVFLPTYGLFDEERFVERGRDIRAFDTPWGRAAILVCEDAWHALSGTIAALDGAQLIVVPSAPPARGAWPKTDEVPGPASVSRWERLTRDMADEHGLYIALANLVGSEAGKQFPGCAMLAGPKGEVRARGPLWEEALVVTTIDLADVTRARADMPLIADLETMMPHLRDTLAKVDAGTPHLLTYDGIEALAETMGVPASSPDGGSDGKSLAAKAAPIPVVAGDAGSGPPRLDIDAPMVEGWLVRFLRDEMERRGFGKVVVGVSGGVDSAVTAFLAARAFGPENVVGVRMPYRTSSAESLEHGQLVIDALGIQCRTVDISAAVDGYLQHEPDADPARRGNVMARMRMITLFDLSAKYRAIPLGTGNKTERLFGYFTWHADDSPPINPLGDLFKTQVWTLARHLGVPEVIVGKAPSADLVVGQTDEGDFGISYAKADELLNWMLSGYLEEDLVARGFDAAEVALVRKRLATTHWKRRLPTVAMLSGSAIGESYLRPVDY
ncbi:MAG TPA: NAD+ synthase [Gemmatimonadaceae bacterium]|nr:NAD+ synthase [Gemmatimonadaceae bacterium]